MRVRLDLPKDPELRFDQLSDLHDELLPADKRTPDIIPPSPNGYVTRRKRAQLYGKPAVSRAASRKLARLPTLEELESLGFIEPPIPESVASSTEDKPLRLAGRVSQILLEGYDPTYEIHIDTIHTIAEAAQLNTN